LERRGESWGAVWENQYAMLPVKHEDAKQKRTGNYKQKRFMRAFKKEKSMRI